MDMDSEILPFRIWIADDDDDFRETLGKSLAQEKRSIRLFANGKDLIEALKRDPSFDIIIADLLMPGGDGLQVLEKSKKINPDGVVVIMTGYAETDRLQTRRPLSEMEFNSLKKILFQSFQE